MSDSTMKKQIFASETELRNVLLHIEQDRAEKEEEIEVKCEEEFEAEKYREIMTSVHFIELNYEEKEWRMRKKLIIDFVSLKNQSRMTQLRKRLEHINQIIDEVKQRLKATKQKDRYKKLLSLLMLEGLYKLLEPHVKVCCLKKDIPLVIEIMRYNKEQFQKKSGISVKIEIDRSTPLGHEAEGGLILVSNDNRKSLCNTLVSRIERIAVLMEPFIYSVIFKKLRRPSDKGFPIPLKSSSISH